MKPLLSWIGVAALLAWTGAGAAAWFMTKDHVSIALSEGESGRAVADDPAALLADDVAQLRVDLAALVATLGQNLEVLDQRSEERVVDLGRQLADVRTELARLQGADEGATHVELRGLREAVAALAARPEIERDRIELVELQPLAPDPSPEPVTPPVAQPVEASDVAPPPAPKRASFLAFTLPSDDFHFDERRRWTVVANLSRVGFDGKSTLHDFTGTTSNLSGAMEFDLSRPSESPSGQVRVDAKSVRTGSDGRDSEMWSVLDVSNNPGFDFALTAFEPESIDAATQTVVGTARGTLTIRGVTRDLAMPVTAKIDDSRRLSLEGEAVLHLPDFGVPVPNKLGLITMEDDVRMWIALRAKLEPRSAEGRTGS